MNQIVSSSYTARELEIPFIGLYAACATMAESLALASIFIDNKLAKNVVAGTCTHFSSAERQYRFPLELGNQRPPTAQWTVTGAGCTIISNKGKGHKITHITYGRVIDYGVSDMNNMGAAMAPAAADTLTNLFKDTKTTPDDYDLILTGDLGKLGSEILIDLMEFNGYKLAENYGDCGQIIYDNTQNTFMGGSGCGCSAAVFNSYVFKKLDEGIYNKVIIMSTGALVSTTSSQQGESIPGIAHAVVIERGN